jgi:hypothetical protein
MEFVTYETDTKTHPYIRMGLSVVMLQMCF